MHSKSWGYPNMPVACSMRLQRAHGLMPWQSSMVIIITARSWHSPNFFLGFGAHGSRNTPPTICSGVRCHRRPRSSARHRRRSESTFFCLKTYSFLHFLFFWNPISRIHTAFGAFTAIQLNGMWNLDILEFPQIHFDLKKLFKTAKTPKSPKWRNKKID